MLLEKGGKYMETHEAEVIEIDKEYYLSLKVMDNTLNIPITKDVPKEVQKVFNQLILSLKKGVFKFSLKEVEDGDIIYHVAKEYISQLNSEVMDVYKEMEGYGLLEVDKNE